MSSSAQKSPENSQAATVRKPVGDREAERGVERVGGNVEALLALQRAAGNRAVAELLRGSSGKPLDRSTRREMETKFGADFGEVRVHTGDEAARTAEMLQADAYTLGRDITFGSGKYHPAGMAGKRLLAHELAHVVQQSRQTGARSIWAETSALEASAERAAAGIGSAAGVQVSGASAVGVARSPKRDKDITKIKLRMLQDERPGERSTESMQLEEDLRTDVYEDVVDNEISLSEARVQDHHKFMRSEGPEYDRMLENRELLEKTAHRRGAHGNDFNKQRGGAAADPNFEENLGMRGDDRRLVESDPRGRTVPRQDVSAEKNLTVEEQGELTARPQEKSFEEMLDDQAVSPEDAMIEAIDASRRAPKSPPPGSSGNGGGGGLEAGKTPSAPTTKRRLAVKVPKAKPVIQSEPSASEGDVSATTEKPTADSSQVEVAAPEPVSVSASEPVRGTVAPTSAPGPEGIPTVPSDFETPAAATFEDSPLMTATPEISQAAAPEIPVVAENPVSTMPEIPLKADPTAAATPEQTVNEVPESPVVATPEVPKPAAATPEAAPATAESETAPVVSEGDVAPGVGPVTTEEVAESGGKLASMLGKAGKVAKVGGHVLGAAGAAYGFIEDYKDATEKKHESKSEAIAGAAGSTIGGFSGGPGAIAANVANLGVHVVGNRLIEKAKREHPNDPEKVKEIQRKVEIAGGTTQTIAEVLPSSMVVQGLKATGRSVVNLVHGDMKAMDRQAEGFERGEAGGPLMGLTMMTDLGASIAGGEDPEHALSRVAKMGENTPLAKAGDYLGDQAFQFVNKDLPEAAEFAKKDVAELKKKTKDKLSAAWNWIKS